MTHTNDPQAQHHKEMQRKRRMGEHEDAHAASGAMSEINITPLIDVILVLLIIFMVVTPLAQKGLDISLTQPPPPNQPPGRRRLPESTSTPSSSSSRTISTRTCPRTTW